MTTLKMATTMLMSIAGGVALAGCERCDGWERSLATTERYEVIYHWQACTSVGTSVAGTLTLVDSVDGSRREFLQFWPSTSASEEQATPSIQWLDSNHMHVTIEQASGVESRVSQLGEVAITYDVGLGP